MCALAGVVAVSTSVLVYADNDSGTPSPLQKDVTHLKTECKSDVKKLCSDVTPGEGRIAACLNSKEDQLSAKCDTAWKGTKAKVSQWMDKQDVSFRKNCTTDVQKFCSSVPSGRGRLLDCLDKNEDGLSNSCKNFQARMKQEVADFVG